MNRPYQGADIDIFSFGVMLLSMRTLHYPFTKAYSVDPKYVQLFSEPTKFWEIYEALQLTDDFKDLITHLLQEKTPSRIVMADLLGHTWMKGEVVTKEQFEARFKTFLDKAAEVRDQEQKSLGIDFQIDKAGKRRRPEKRGNAEAELKGIEKHAFRPVPNLQLTGKPTRFVVNGEAFGVICTLYDVIRVHLDENVKVGKNSWKLKFEGGFSETEYESKEEAKQEATMVTEKNQLLEQKA